MTYGIPYMGSKSGIAEWVVAHLPPGEVLVDVFAGGCAVTHAALLSRKWKRIIANDISDAPQLFLDAVHGRYADERRWISREEFERHRLSDPYIRYCWSFGNRGDTYMYSRELEPYKRARHRQVFAETPHARHIAFRECVRLMLPVFQSCILKNLEELERLGGMGSMGSLRRLELRGKLDRLETLENLQNLHRLQALESLQGLEVLEGLEVRRGDYRDLEIPPGAVVYCDPPYRGTEKYNAGAEFDHEAFYAWCRSLACPVVISEYSMPEGFRKIARIEKRRLMCPAVRSSFAMERLYALNYSPPVQGELEMQP